MLMPRMIIKIRSEIEPTQFGFVTNKGTPEMMIQPSIEIKKELYLCFIYYAKADNRVQHEERTRF